MIRWHTCLLVSFFAFVTGCKSSSVDGWETSSCAELEGIEPINDGHPYEPPPFPCEVKTESGHPYLEMPRNEVMETYLPSVTAIETFAIDYLVYPAPHVVRGTSMLESRDDAEPTSLEIMECAAEIPVVGLFQGLPDDDVHVSRVTLFEADGDSRSARVFAPRGARSLSIDTNGVVAESDTESDWYVLYEPIAGPPRITLRRLEALAGIVTVDALPDTAGVVAVFRSEALASDEEQRVVYGPTGFAQAWRYFAEDWYGAMVPAGPTGTIELERRSVPTEVVQLSVEETVTLDDDMPTALLMLAPGSAMPAGSIAVIVPCNAQYRVTLDGYGEAMLDTSEPIALKPGRPVDGTAACGEEVSELELRIKGYASGTRHMYVVVTHWDESP